MSRGEPVDSWSGTSFTGQNRVRAPTATHVCEPCVFVCSRLSPVPGRPAKEGKKLGGNFRNYSSMAELRPDGSWEYLNASKGEKPIIREFIARDHGGAWFAAIADSGQKHVIPWAPMNGRGRSGRVLFDEQPILVPSDQSLVSEMMALLTVGATKEEMESGNYRASTYERCCADVQAFERAHGGRRRSGWFALALWLAQRDEDAVQERLAREKETKDAKRRTGRKTADKDGGSDARATRRVSRRTDAEHTEALGDLAEQGKGGRADDGGAGAVGDGGVPRASGAKPNQLNLFGGG